MKTFLRLGAAGATVAVLVHLTAALAPPVNAYLYSPAYPLWRHLVFIAIDGALVSLLPDPPPWLIWPFGVLSIQVLYSHGLGGWRAWRATGRIGWLDPIAVAGVLVLFVVLVGYRRRPARLFSS